MKIKKQFQMGIIALGLMAGLTIGTTVKAIPEPGIHQIIYELTGFVYGPYGQPELGMLSKLFRSGAHQDPVGQYFEQLTAGALTNAVSWANAAQTY